MLNRVSLIINLHMPVSVSFRFDGLPSDAPCGLLTFHYRAAELLCLIKGHPSGITVTV